MRIVDGVVYPGGSFGTIVGQNRARIAALEASSGHATDWDPARMARVAVIAPC